MSLQLSSGGRWSRLILPQSGNRYRREKKRPVEAVVSRRVQSNSPEKARSSVSFTLKNVRRILAWMVLTTGAVVFFLTASLGLLAAYRYMTNHTYFELKTVEVRGNAQLSYAEVLGAAGVSLGSNCLELKMGAAEAGLVANPWIERAAVRRVLPDKLVITVTERKPFFWLVTEGQVMYGDVKGKPIAPVRAERLKALPLLKAGLLTETALARYRELLEAKPDSGVVFPLADAAWVRIDAGDGLEFYIEEQDRYVYISFTEWDRNVARLTRVWTDLERRGELKDVTRLEAHGGKIWARNPVNAGAWATPAS